MSPPSQCSRPTARSMTGSRTLPSLGSRPTARSTTRSKTLPFLGSRSTTRSKTLPWQCSSPMAQAVRSSRFSSRLQSLNRRVFVHYTASAPGSPTAALQLVRRLRAAGFTVEGRAVEFPIPEDSIRYFFNGDRDEAEAVSAQLRGRVPGGTVPIVDFTSHEPKPRQGHLEVWLGGLRQLRADPGRARSIPMTSLTSRRGRREPSDDSHPRQQPDPSLADRHRLADRDLRPGVLLAGLARTARRYSRGL